METGVTALTEALLNPAKRMQLKQIARMAPSTKQLLLLSGLLSVQTGKVAVTTNRFEEIRPRTDKDGARVPMSF